MREDMPNIDTSGIDALRELKKEQDVIRERLDKMSGMKEKVSEAVFQKVHDEYQTKLGEVAAEAEPLKNKLRVQYGVLRGLMNDIEGELNTYNMQKEELEFRNTLGEYSSEDFDEQIKEWELKNTSKQAELEELDNTRTLFLTVFDSEDDLESPKSLETVPITTLHPEEPVAAEEEPASEEVEEDDLEELEELEEVEEEHEDDVSVAETAPLTTHPGLSDDSGYEVPPAPDTDNTDDLLGDDADLDLSLEEPGDPTEDLELPMDEIEDLPEDALDVSGELDTDFDDLDTGLDTSDLSDDDMPTQNGPNPLGDPTAMETQPVAPIPTVDQTDPTADVPPLPDAKATLLASDLMSNDEIPATDGTVIISNPKIISLNNATEGQVIVLGMGTTSVGRSPENDLHLAEDRISRKHSQIAFGPGGYSIYDLNSENGTFVNGNRVREHFLADGDIIMIGTYKFLYRDR